MNMHQHAFLTAEGIELKQTLLEQDVENIKHLDFLGSFAQFTWACQQYYVRRPWTVRQYAGFSTAERKAMLLQTKLGC
jgi:methylmalonyl-CoA mutase